MDSEQVAEILNHIGDKYAMAGFDGLERNEQIALSINLLEFEITVGWLGTYYKNSSGKLAAFTVFALQEIGAQQSAEILHQANALFPGGNPPSDWEERQDALLDFNEEADERLQELTSALHEVGEVWPALEAFVAERFPQPKAIK